MEHATFDRIVTALASATTRRAGLAAAVAAALGRSAAGVVAGPGSQSQCGKRADSTCQKDSDCCSGRCVTGLANKDGSGRCRCVRRNKPCTADKDCCARRGQSMVCLDGVCSPPCLPLGQTCDATSTCCAGVCGGVLSGDRALASTCCVLEEGACSKDADCCGASFGNWCSQGACTSCFGPESPCDAERRCCTGFTCVAGTCVQDQ